MVLSENTTAHIATAPIMTAAAPAASCSRRRERSSLFTTGVKPSSA
jgi:hypothetical protein